MSAHFVIASRGALAAIFSGQSRSRDRTEYFAYRLVELERVGERAHQRTLLNPAKAVAAHGHS